MTYQTRDKLAADIPPATYATDGEVLHAIQAVINKKKRAFQVTVTPFTKRQISEVGQECCP